MKDVTYYIELGYELSPYSNDGRIESIRTVDLSPSDCRNLLFMNSDDRFSILEPQKEGEHVMFKAQPYHVLPKDLVVAFEVLKKEYDKEECKLWLNFFNFNYKNEYIYSPVLVEDEINYSDFNDDYLFDIDDHIVLFIVNAVYYDFNRDKEPSFDKYIGFINEVLEQRKSPVKNRKYSDKTLSMLLQNLCYVMSVPGNIVDEEINTFYHHNLVSLAEKGDYDSMRTIGYEYYEGSNGFEYDPHKSIYYLEKCFSISNDPELARTLGYIYYYGRTTNGVPDGNKAFQYFAIGHIAGHYYEATYKLADCYVKGYGTPVCHQAAYELVNGIYEDTLAHFLNGNDSKFADVALRMGSYYKDGVYVSKDLHQARAYYLEARCAIKKRLEHMEYIGDRGVAIGISKTLEELNNQLGYKCRAIKNNGYLLNDYYQSFHNVKFKFSLDKDGYLHFTMSRFKSAEVKYLLHVVPELNLSERVGKIQYIIKCANIDQTNVDFMNSHKIKEVHFASKSLIIVYDDKELKGAPAFMVLKEVVYVPQTIKNINKKFNIVSVEYYPGSKLYDYLVLKNNVKIGDTLSVKSNGEMKSVVVKSIKQVYEDELPLPLEKMAKAK